MPYQMAVKAVIRQDLVTQLVQAIQQVLGQQARLDLETLLQRPHSTLVASFFRKFLGL